MTTRRLDRKLENIAAGRYTPADFAIADAKDGDMAFGLTAPGPRPGAPGLFRSRQDYLDDMRGQVAQGDLDILLCSASNGEVLTNDGSLGEDVTLAVRANDTTDIWNQRGGSYPKSKARPFRTVNLQAIKPFCDLVLYAVTFNHDLDHDLAAVQAYGEFRREAAALGIRHFLEVFNPNAPQHLAPEQVGAFVNDSITRTLAGVTRSERPLFLKLAYNGGAALSELVQADSSLVVGVLGGGAGTTRDTFELLARSEAHGARVALFGRKIQRADSQLRLVSLMPKVLRGDLTPADAVRAYHEALAEDGVIATRTLEADLEVTDPVLTAE